MGEQSSIVFETHLLNGGRKLRVTELPKILKKNYSTINLTEIRQREEPMKLKLSTKWLFGGTVPPNKRLFGGTVPPNKRSFGDTVKLKIGRSYVN